MKQPINDSLISFRSETAYPLPLLFTHAVSFRSSLHYVYFHTVFRCSTMFQFISWAYKAHFHIGLFSLMLLVKGLNIVSLLKTTCI